MGRAASILQRYTVENAANMVFAISEENGRQFQMGGNAQMIAVVIADLL